MILASLSSCPSSEFESLSELESLSDLLLRMEYLESCTTKGLADGFFWV